MSAKQVLVRSIFFILCITHSVDKGNVVGYVNSSSNRCLEIQNYIWEYNEIEPRPWDEKEWGWVMIVSTKPIHVGEKFFLSLSSHFLNFDFSYITKTFIF